MMTQSGDRPPPESREYLEEIMKQEVEDAKERRRIRRMSGQKKPRYKTLGVLLFILVIMIGLNVARIVTAPDPFTPAEEEAGAMFTIYLVVQGVEAFRDSAGFLPVDLEGLDLDEEGLTYTVRDSSYTLHFQEEGITASYRSGENLAPYIAAYEALERGGGP